MPWPKVYEGPSYMNVNFIHPLKQKKVMELVENTKTNYPEVDAIVVFGSSTTVDCTVYSDIDLLIWKPEGYRFLTPMNDEYDVLMQQWVGRESELWREVLKKGVVVYVSDSVDKSRNRHRYG